MKGTRSPTRLSPTGARQILSRQFKASLTLPVTYHVVIAFDRDAEGDLKPGEAREVLSPIVAERRARALVLEHAGALALVNELHKALVPPRGLIASGKFEQYKRDIPYATLAQAFRSLVRPILGESETHQLVRWRKSLSEAL